MTTPTRRPLGRRLWVAIASVAVVSVASPVVAGVGSGLAEGGRLSGDIPGLHRPVDVSLDDTQASEVQGSEGHDVSRRDALSIDTPGLIAPRVIREMRPVYAAQAKRAGVQGTVLLEVVIKSDGAVGHARVIKGIDPGLDNATLMAAREWLFEPATLNGQPAAVVAYVEFSFGNF